MIHIFRYFYFPTLLVSLVLVTPGVEASIYDDFQYKIIIVGVRISTVNMSSVPGLVEEVHIFRDIIFSTLVNTQKNEDNSTADQEQISNITVVTLDESTDFTTIPDISILITILDCTETFALNTKVTELYGPVVHIAITEPGCPRLDSKSAITMTMALFRHEDEVQQLIVDMRQQNALPNWKSAVVIHDLITGDEIVDSILESFKSRVGISDVATILFTIDSRSHLKSLERQLEDVFRSYNARAGNFLVVTPRANIEPALSLAKRMGLLKHTMQWMFLAPDKVTTATHHWGYVAERIIADGVNLAFVSNGTSGIGTYEQFFCNLKQMLFLLTQTIEDLATDEYNLYIQVSDEEWENIKSTRVERVWTIIQNATSDMDDLIQNVCQNTYNPSWKLDAAEHGKYGKRVFEVGDWQTFKGLRLNDDVFPHIVGGFRGRKIKIASMHYPPWQIFSRNVTTGAPVYLGLIFEIVNHMGDTLNFTYEVLEPQDGGTWGSENFDGTWNGMMRQVINEEVVLGAAAFTIRPEKSKVVNFTMVLEREAYTFMVNRPSELSRVLLFAEPFSKEVWLCIATSVLIVAPIFYLIHKNSAFYTVQRKNTRRGLFQLKNCFLYIYGALLQQGGSQLPEAISGRMLIGFWWLFVLVTVTTYSGNLVAFLTFPRVEVAVNSFKDVVAFQGVSTWGFLAGSVIESYLKVSNNSEIIKLYRHAMKHPSVNETLLNKIRFQNHAYIDWKISLMLVMKEQFLKDGKCDFVLGREEIFEEQIALIVPRSSPYLERFNEEIKWMLQSGLIIRWKGKYWPKKDKCSSLIATAAANRTVKIGDMQGSFYLLMLGFFIALLVLGIEYVLHRRKQGKIIDSIKIFVTSNKNTEFWQQKQYPFLH
ncbi:unnamed protein product [Allacma fusca]|uniref:Ionotropic glutamate receptor L-glutamate and glycine-binding domain-containing protein n=1 Tax=Allacma fusca TaxID=39272 RepID=A0A8J2LQT7_9HEXA|nr:unnamed protein product [Allacma fusca]